MGIKFQCPNCKKQLEAENDHSGMKLECPECKTAVEVPKPSLKTTGTQQKEEASNTKLHNCKSCNKPISKDAKQCPHCGAPNESQKTVQAISGCLGIIIFIVIAFFFWGDGCSFPKKSLETYNEGDNIKTGNISYNVSNSRWASSIGYNKFNFAKPDARFLLVNVSVKNEDKEARNIPAFTLLDENGAEYETSKENHIRQGTLNLLDALNPGVSKTGMVIFDVPESNKYKLKASGEYGSGKEALITLNPR